MPRRLDRGDTTSFNMRTDCFICGKASTRPEHLIAISTGTGASTREKVLHAASERLDESVHFIDERLSKKTKSFWESKTRQQCTTFKDMKTSIVKSRQFHMDSDVLFRRLLAVSKQREVSMEMVMSHELAAVPPSLFYDDGCMRKRLLLNSRSSRMVMFHQRTSLMAWLLYRVSMKQLSRRLMS